MNSIYNKFLNNTGLDQIITIKSNDTRLIFNNNKIKQSFFDIGKGVELNGIKSFSECIECPLNYYNINDKSNNCILCDDDDNNNYQCLGRDIVLIEYNHWIGFDVNHIIQDITICPASFCCQHELGCNYINDISNNGRLCALNRNHSIPLCGSCIDGYSEVFGSSKCAKCDDNNYHYLLFPFCIAMSFVLCLFIIKTRDSVDDDILINNKNEWKNNIEKLLLNDDIKCLCISYLRPLIYFYQSVSYILVTSGYLFYLLPIAKLLSLEFLFVTEYHSSYSTGICFLNKLNTFEKELWYLFFPLSMLIAIAIFSILGKLLKIYCNKNLLIFNWNILWTVILISIGSVLTKTFKILACSHIDKTTIHFYSGDLNVINIFGLLH